jgi:hypothetical protein
MCKYREKLIQTKIYLLKKKENEYNDKIYNILNNYFSEKGISKIIIEYNEYDKYEKCKKCNILFKYNNREFINDLNNEYLNRIEIEYSDVYCDSCLYKEINSCNFKYLFNNFNVSLEKLKLINK